MRIGLDLDGTLISCMQKQTALMQALTSAHNISVDINRFWSYKRNGLNNIRALEQCSIESRVAKLLNKQWVEQIELFYWMDLDTVLDGAIEFLESQVRNGNSLHLVSARNNKQNSFLQLDKLNLTKYFETIDFVSGNLNESKKDKFIQRKIDLYIGDTEQDLLQAQKSGVKCYLVSSGMRSKLFLKELTVANKVFEKLTLLIDVV